MNKRILASLYKKEMLDVLRDRKTVLMMIVVPLLLYPLLFIVGFWFIGSVSNDINTATYNVACSDMVEQELVDFILDYENDEATYKFKLIKTDDIQNAFSEGVIDAYISCREVDGKKEYSVSYLSSVNNSSYAADFVSEALGEYSYDITVKLIEAANLSPEEILSPIDIKFVDISTKEESAGSMLGIILPFMLIFSLLLGTMYPAIDTTAGEKERGTLETVLTLPITNRQLIFSKFLAVATIGIVSAILNLLSMAGVGAYMMNMMQQQGVAKDIDMLKFAPAVVVVILCVVAFAVFMSAVTMCVCAFAKTYKEANNYITPLTLIVMFASFIEFLPNIELSRQLALVPVANICLLVRDILMFKFDLAIIAIVLVSNIAYGIIAVMILGKLYNSENILFGDGSDATVIFEKRKNMIAGGVPSVGDVWLVAAIVAVAVIYLGGLAQVKYGVLGVVITQLIIVGVPMLMAIYSKKSIKKTFKLRCFKLVDIPVALVLIIGALMLGMALTAIVGSVFSSSAENIEASADMLFGNEFPIALVVVALLPAVCEELLFRGYVLGALTNRYSNTVSIILSSALFGIYHMSVVKFFTTALLGAVIAYVAHKTKSLIPGIIMHFTNNAIACLAMYYPTQLGKVFPLLTADKLFISDILILIGIGIALLTIGVILMKYIHKDKRGYDGQKEG